MAITAAFIESAVRKALREIERSPERGIRRFLDETLSSADGDFAAALSAGLMKMLGDPSSEYRTLLHHALGDAERDRLVGFAVNLGFYGIKKGSAAIAENKKKYGTEPAIAPTIYVNDNKLTHALLNDVLEYGTKLGISIYILFAEGDITPVIPMLRRKRGCAFIMVTDGARITNELIQKTRALKNIMFFVRTGKSAGAACQRLHSAKYLCSLYCEYGVDDAPRITDGTVPKSFIPYAPLCVIFSAAEKCGAETRQAVGEFITAARDEQRYPFLMFDAETYNNADGSK